MVNRVDWDLTNSEIFLRCSNELLCFKLVRAGFIGNSIENVSVYESKARLRIANEFFAKKRNE